MPGKMVQCLKSVGTANPLVLIDEIDKVIYLVSNCISFLKFCHLHCNDICFIYILGSLGEAMLVTQPVLCWSFWIQSKMQIFLTTISTLPLTSQRLLIWSDPPINGYGNHLFYMSWSISLQVLFVCTANVIDMIPNPLLDRMEVISIAGYITDEKVHIARDYLEKTARGDCGIKPEQVSTFILLSNYLWSLSNCFGITYFLLEFS